MFSLWQDLSEGTKILNLLTLTFDLLFKNFNLGYNFWMVSTRALVFHMYVPYDKTVPWVPQFLTSWPWPWSLTYFSKTLTLAITFERQVMGLSYYTCVFLMTSPFYWCQNFWPPDLDLEDWVKVFTNFNIGHNFWMANGGTFILHMCVS